MPPSGASEIERPEPSYQPNASEDENNVNEQDPNLEATELANYSTAAQQELDGQPHARDRSKRIRSKRGLRRVVTDHPRPADNWLRKFWRHHVRITVHHEDCRDHFALERTYLGYFRTASALCMMGITIAQLFRLDRNPDPINDIDFYETGKPLAGLFIAAAIAVILLGAVRFWRLQNAMVRAKTRAAGWELHALTACIVGLLVVLFAVVLRVDIKIKKGKDSGDD